MPLSSNVSFNISPFSQIFIKEEYGVITLNHKRKVMLSVHNKLTFYLVAI